MTIRIQVDDDQFTQEHFNEDLMYEFVDQIEELIVADLIRFPYNIRTDTTYQLLPDPYTVLDPSQIPDDHFMDKITGLLEAREAIWGQAYWDLSIWAGEFDLDEPFTICGLCIQDGGEVNYFGYKKSTPNEMLVLIA